MRWTICCLLVVLCRGAAAQPVDGKVSPWRSLYEDGRWDAGVQTWLGNGTHSRRTPEGLLVADPSSEKGTGRFYMLQWSADPRKGAAIEARVKVASCAQPWGVALMVADGVHEEGLTLFPKRLQLENAKQSVDFDAASGFHTYRLEIRGTDVRLVVDGKLLVDGVGKFTTPAQGAQPRNQCGFGCGASPATGEAVWQWVKYQSDLPAKASRGKGDRHLLCNDHASMVPAEGPSRQKVPVTFSVSRGSVGGIVLLAGAMFGWAVAAASIAAVQRWAMPTPQPARPMVRVVLDRTVSEVPLSRNGFSNPSGKGFALFEQWIPRLGYFTARRSGVEAFTGDLLVVVCPTRSPSEQFLGRLAEYVEQGGKLLVIDSPEIENSTANALLWPFGLSIERGISAKGSLKLSSARPAVPVEAACEVEGGEPLLRLGANPVAARVRHGAGQVTAIGFGSVFHDEQMGGNWMTEPDRDLLARFHLLLDLVRSAATGRPLVEPAAPRSGSPGPKSRLLPLPRMPGR